MKPARGDELARHRLGFVKVMERVEHVTEEPLCGLRAAIHR
jgi:hypothetical protein